MRLDMRESACANLLLVTHRLALQMTVVAVVLKCSCQNFARRQECYRCSAPKTDTCVTIALGPSPAGHGAAMGLDPYGDAVRRIINSFEYYAFTCQCGCIFLFCNTTQVVSTQTPNSCLVVRGLTLLTSEDQVRMFIDEL